MLTLAETAVASESPQIEFPRAEIIEKVVSQTDRSQSYTLYLPSSYTPDKKWPILYCFDPRENGARPAELFRDAAEKYGYIIASSNNFRSDDASVPGMQTANAMWVDTHSRFSIQENRAYATGFSGGARISCDLGIQRKGLVAGVIGCGAGFPSDHPPSEDIPFDYFGIVGDKDFNYFEMMTVGKAFEPTAVPFKLDVFDGPHSWPPADVCTRAIEWMELRAMKEGKKDKEPTQIDSLFEIQMRYAGSLESAGRILDAFDEYHAMIRDFDGLHDISAVSQKFEQLKSSPDLASELALQESREQKAIEFTRKFGSVIKSIRDTSRPVPRPETVTAFLGMDELKKQAGKGTTPQDQAAAISLLELIYVQTAFYLPRTFLQLGDYPRAILCLSIAAQAKEKSPDVWYGLASVYALMGDKKNAVNSLNRAIDFGFGDLQALQQDSDFESIREDKEYQEIVERLRKNGQNSKN